MTLPVWPAAFPKTAQRDGYRGTAHQPHRRTEMDKGNARLRARSLGSPAEIELKWRFAGSRANDFKLFYENDLARGTRWFTVPLWFGGEHRAVPAQFMDRFTITPRAASAVTISTRLCVRRMPYDALEEGELDTFFDPQGRPVWPESLPEGPLRTGIDIDPHRPVLMTELEEGPKTKRDLFGPSPAAQLVQWSMSPAQFETFKAFYVEGLVWGTRWFMAPLWFGRSLDRVPVRFREPFAFEPRFAARVLVTATVEARRLPVIPPGVQALLAMMGAAGLSSLSGGIHDFVHETWPDDFGSEE
ncbi:hypothetical protein [Parvibaculum sp.]|uniref:hypothetical protein n=1 Tax=Parvibaculum sp. TaxID=2024848 RepID=UPI000C68E76F|nr:hypothetical protein [Parvibaculum sp.]MAM95674.1 hypothetical protein [Parvibaculum sp.]|tara:strand:- start:4062 stop:4964 length:903 start_codon:yes stop_codon:yes gene_type:complete